MAKRKDYQFSKLSRSSKWRRCQGRYSAINETSDVTSDDTILDLGQVPSNNHTQSENIISNDILECVTPSNLIDKKETAPNLTLNSSTSSDTDTVDTTRINSDSVPSSSSSRAESDSVLGDVDSDNEGQLRDANSSNHEMNFYSCSSTNTREEDPPLKSFLRTWAVESNVPLKTLDVLLSGLKKLDPQFENLPSTGRTLVRTPRHITTRKVDPGYYIHIGVKNQLKLMVSQISITFDCLNLLISIDGLPPFKSAQGEFYPILIAILNVPSLKNIVLPVGIYYGPEKPNDLNEFLREFVSEVKSLVDGGLELNEQLIPVNISAFCCDAPAKSYIMGVKGHGGFSSCTKCSIVGETVKGRRVFLDCDAEKRTHDDFITRKDKHYRCRDTPLVEIPGLDFNKSFVLDYMHLVCLGVMRTLIVAWISGKKSSLNNRISKTQRDIISAKMTNDIKTSFPTELARKPREISLVLRWKATEFRSFLLYVGPVVLKDILPQEKYLHFLELHVGMTILLSPRLCSLPGNRENARNLLRHFVQSTSALYGVEFITHNFHGLIHLVDEAENFLDSLIGFSLNDLSAFAFENYLQKIKNMLRGRNKPLEQIGKRLAEHFQIRATKKKTNQMIYPHFPPTSQHVNGPLLTLCLNPQYKKCMFENFEISTTPGNCFFETKKHEIVKVENFCYSKEIKGMVAVGKSFLNKTDFYGLPLPPSSSYGIYKVSRLSDWKCWPVSSIKKKYICFPYKENYNVAFPLIHCS